jgi:hypothetical protein
MVRFVNPRPELTSLDIDPARNVDHLLSSAAPARSSICDKFARSKFDAGAWSVLDAG